MGKHKRKHNTLKYNPNRVDLIKRIEEKNGHTLLEAVEVAFRFYRRYRTWNKRNKKKRNNGKT